MDGEPTPGREAPGVGPAPEPWPDDPRLDPELLAGGDSRNVADRYRYWRTAAIVEDLDARRHPFHVAVENWQHDLNIGAVVRNANAFLAEAVHIVGRRRWNRRGAMVTDRYQHVLHHDSVEAFVAWAAGEGLPVLGVDNLPGSVAIDAYPLPRRCALLFGQEGPGPVRRGPRRLRGRARDPPVRLDAVDQRRGGLGRGDARVGAAARAAHVNGAAVPQPGECFVTDVNGGWVGRRRASARLSSTDRAERRDRSANLGHVPGFADGSAAPAPDRSTKHAPAALPSRR